MIKIEIEKKTRKAKIDNIIIGNDGENLQDTLQFCFKDEFVDGQARLELKFQNGETTFVVLDKIEQTYTTLLSNVMTKRGKVFAQLVITENGINDKIPVFKSDMFYFICNQSINAEEETREPYVEWIDRANAKLNEVDNLDIDASKVNDITTITITKKDKSTKIVEIKDGEKGDKGEPGEKGDTYQVNEEDLKAIAKDITDNANSDFNKNVTDKTNLFNTNAETKTTDYNTNASEKLNTYNTNSDNKIKEYNDNATSKTTEFNDNASNKTTDYNNNATTELNKYNTNASAKLQEYNDNATQKIEEYNAHSQELDNKIVSTRNELERVKNDVLETGTDTDTFIHLEDSAMAEYQELEVDGVCKQETTKGSNYFDAYKIPSSNNFVIEDNGKTIKIPIVSSGQGYHYTNASLKQLCPNLSVGDEVYLYFTRNLGTKYNNYIYLDTGSGLWGNGTKQTITQKKLDSNVSIYGNNFQGGETTQCILTDFRIVKSQGDLWEPYTGGQPSPSPDYPQEISTIENSLKITSCNKNLFDLDGNITTNFRDTDFKEGNSIVDNKLVTNWNIEASQPIGQKIYVGIGNLVTMSATLDNIDIKTDTNYGAFITLQNQNTTSGQQQLHFKTSEKGTRKTIKLVSTTEYIYATFGVAKTYVNSATFSDIQVEIGKYTDFEQHLETQITANLPEGEFIGKISDTYKDTLKVEYNEEDGQYHLNLYKNVGKDVLDGSENLIMDTAGGFTRFSTSVVGSISASGRHEIISTYFRYSNSTNEIGIGFITSNRLYLYPNSDITTVNEFKSWLSTHNTEVYYALATPYVVDLGIVDMPITYNETTNLFTDSDLSLTINAKYYRNFITTIKNLQVNEKALKQELIDINNRLSALESAQTNVVSESEVVE